jgi:hypothetical protein
MILCVQERMYSAGERKDEGSQGSRRGFLALVSGIQAHQGIETETERRNLR